MSRADARRNRVRARHQTDAYGKLRDTGRAAVRGYHGVALVWKGWCERGRGGRGGDETCDPGADAALFFE